MKRRSLRTLSLVLTAVMVLSVANPGITASATEVDSVIEQEAVSEETTTEVVTEATTEVVTEASEAVTTEAATEVATEAVTEVSTEETTTEAAKKETKKLEGKVDVPESKYASVSSGTRLSAVFKDATLLSLVVDIYNDKKGSALTVNNITAGDLQNYDGSLNFTGMSGVASVTSIEGLGVASGATAIDIRALTGVTSIPDGEFAGCQFNSFVMPTTITSIGSTAFDSCSKLTTIKLPNGLKSIGDEAFDKCSKLASINTTSEDNTLPSGLTYVGQKAFLDNIALTTINLPAFSDGSVLQNAASLFSGCTALQTIKVSKAITILPSDIFSNAGTAGDGVSVQFDSTSKLKKIHSRAFYGAKFSASVFDLSNCTHLTGIGPSVFQGSSGLGELQLPENATAVEIGEYAFAQTNLSRLYAGDTADGTYHIYLPDYVTSIGKAAFYAVDDFESVSLPYAIPEIADHLFDDCINLSTVEQRKDNNGSCNVALIGDCAFRNTAITNTNFLLNMNNLTQIGRQLVNDYCLGKGTDSNEEEKIASIPAGGIDSANKLVEKDVAHKKYDNKECGSEVFTGCDDLREIKIPASVKIIAARAFYVKADDAANEKAKVTEIVWKGTTGVSGTIRKIYAEAFRNNVSVTSLSLPQNSGECLQIGACAFYKNEKLDTIQCNETTTTSLPNTLTALEHGAFMKCKSITELHVRDVNGAAPVLQPQVFEGCTSMTRSSLPAATTAIPYHFYALCPLTSFNFNQLTSLSFVGELAFFGHQFTTIDLSACGSLAQISGEAFAHQDSLKKNSYMDKEQNYLGVADDVYPVLKTVVLPVSLESLYLNTGVFDGQELFDTMYAGSGSEGVITIPDYMPVPAKAVFAYTGVKKVVWEADTNGNVAMRWKIIPEYTFEGCQEIEEAASVLPMYVEKIGERAFAGSYIESADLTSFVNLSEIGYGSVDSGSDYGTFMDCKYLTTVKLPTNNVNGGIILDRKTFAKSALGSGCAVLTTVELGSASTLGQYCFTGCKGLENIDLANVKKLDTYAFSDCDNLTTVDFGVVETIGQNAFLSCEKLVLTGTALPDTLLKIDSYAFKDASSIGEVVLGAGIKEIGASAFVNSGLTNIDFTNAGMLTTIGQSAFEGTKLTKFVLEGTKVAVIEMNTFKLCSQLTDATFGEEVQIIKKDALQSCAKFKNFRFYASTTVSKQVFESATSQMVDGVSTPQVTGMNNGTKTSENGIQISVTVDTPEETVVSYGRQMSFPYYVNEKGTSSIAAIRIVDRNDQTNTDVEQLLQVRAKVSDGYYKCTNVNDPAYIVSEEYFTRLETADTEKVKYGNTTGDVDVIKVSGLRETTPNERIQLEIIAGISFTCKDGYTINSDSFNATYNIRVVDPSPMAVVYTDNKLTNQWPSAPQIQAINASKGSATYYYSMVDRYETASTIPSSNVVVETSNPAVIYPSSSTSPLATPPTTYTTKATTTASNGTVTTNASNMKFCLIPAGLGTATISVYPEGCTEEQKAKYKKTYTVTVGSDVNTITLQVPSEYNSGAAPGSAFSVFKEYKNYFNQVCSSANMADFHNLTNTAITFTSDAPDYVSVDQYGNVQVLKADGVSKYVKITATANNSQGGYKKTATVSINVKYPTVKANQEAVDPATGAKVKVTRVSTTDLQGEVVYEGSSDSSTTNVVIPDTVTINGLRYKVTTIKAGMFKNNKKIKTISIGNYVKNIEENAFSGCSNLTTVKIGSEVTTIGKKAFYNCKKLKTLTLASKGKLNTIGESAFQNCYKLTKVKIPNSVTRIENKAFYNCKVLKTVTISSSAKLTNIGNQSFAKCVKLTAITLPKKFTSLGTQAFLNCKALKKITVKSTVLSSVGTNALKGIHKKCVIKVPKKKLAQYKSLFAKKGQKSSVKVKK
ncbi:MAG: leucine-rich repeat protein [Lachnospiraceae bacterium]|nr:leucine-rich repeat protein [Lachnospiraceae bacterium]